MFRIIYRWSVKAEDFEQFEKIWLQTTNTIYNNIKGAMGSLLMKSPNEKDIVIGIARWRSIKDWENFWNDSTPLEMESLSDYAIRISVEIFEEVEDRTVL